MDGSKLNNFKTFQFENEYDFEKHIISNKVLQDYHVFDGKNISLNFKIYRRYADVILIEKNYRHWMIGEVEISAHSFSNHIFPQLLEINTLIEKNTDLIRDKILNENFIRNDYKIRELIEYNKPLFCLIINDFPDKYRGFLEILKSLTTIFIITTLKDNLERYIFSTNEIKSHLFTNLTTQCYVKKNFLYIDMPNLVLMDLENDELLFYNNKPIRIKNSVHNNKYGFKICIWTMDKKLTNGKYFLKRNDKSLILYK